MKSSVKTFRIYEKQAMKASNSCDNLKQENNQKSNLSTSNNSGRSRGKPNTPVKTTISHLAKSKSPKDIRNEIFPTEESKLETATSTNPSNFRNSSKIIAKPQNMKSRNGFDILDGSFKIQQETPLSSERCKQNGEKISEVKRESLDFKKKVQQSKNSPQQIFIDCKSGTFNSDSSFNNVQVNEEKGQKTFEYAQKSTNNTSNVGTKPKKISVIQLYPKKMNLLQMVQQNLANRNVKMNGKNKAKDYQPLIEQSEQIFNKKSINNFLKQESKLEPVKSRNISPRTKLASESEDLYVNTANKLKVEFKDFSALRKKKIHRTKADFIEYVKEYKKKMNLSLGFKHFLNQYSKSKSTTVNNPLLNIFQFLSEKELKQVYLDSQNKRMQILINNVLRETAIKNIISKFKSACKGDLEFLKSKLNFSVPFGRKKVNL
jgi:hypothetical protein